MAVMESGVASDERILKARGSTPAARFGPGFAKTLSLEKTEQLCRLDRRSAGLKAGARRATAFGG